MTLTPLISVRVSFKDNVYACVRDISFAFKFASMCVCLLAIVYVGYFTLILAFARGIYCGRSEFSLLLRASSNFISPINLVHS